MFAITLHCMGHLRNCLFKGGGYYINSVEKILRGTKICGSDPRKIYRTGLY